MKEKLKSIEKTFFEFIVFAVFGILFFPLYFSRYQRLKEKKEAEKQKQLIRAKYKFFTVRITKNWWGNKLEYIMRDTPLTEEQLDAIELDFEKNKENYSQINL
jgi:hypothetical protein